MLRPVLLAVFFITLSGCASGSFDPAKEGYYTLDTDRARTPEQRIELFQKRSAECEADAKENPFLNKTLRGEKTLPTGPNQERVVYFLCLVKDGWYLR